MAESGYCTNAADVTSSIPRGESIFTCSFCHLLYTGSPSVLGRSRRLACPKCAIRAVNLSICWVCGELVVRGDECVRLGLCFWHRACYGCLFYGSGEICRGVSVRALFADGARGRAFGLAREVMEPPLCAACWEDMKIEESNEKGVERGDSREMQTLDGALEDVHIQSPASPVLFDLHDPAGSLSSTSCFLGPVQGLVRHFSVLSDRNGSTIPDKRRNGSYSVSSATEPMKALTRSSSSGARPRLGISLIKEEPLRRPSQVKRANGGGEINTALD